MGFIPCVGDRVIFNPNALMVKSEYTPFPPLDSRCKEIYLVSSISNHPLHKDGRIVELVSRYITTYIIDVHTGTYWELAQSAGHPDIPLFQLVSKAVTKPIQAVDLKVLNSKPDATHCASCNSLLKEPFPRIKYCPKCEP